MNSCNEKLRGHISTLYCCSNDSKIGLQEEQEQQNQVEPIEEPVIVHQQPNEVAIFTVTNKQVHHADLTTQSSSKMGNKTRQTYLEWPFSFFLLTTFLFKLFLFMRINIKKKRISFDLNVI